MTKRFVGQARVDGSFHTCHTNSTHKLGTAKWHTMYRHAIYPNVYPLTSYRGNYCEIVQWSTLSHTFRQLLLQLPRRTKNLANNSGAIKLLSSRHSCRSAIATAQLKDHCQRRAVKGAMSKKRCNREAPPLVGSLPVLYKIEYWNGQKYVQMHSTFK